MMNTRSYTGKRLFDIVGAGTALLLLAPLLVLIALLVRIKHGAPVLFIQMRPGLHGRLFRILKFRTMTDERDANGDLLPDAARLTPFGRLLRATSMDELPELWNVLRGDMSLVGPRPLLPHYLNFYSSEQMRRHELRPGLTGWAQVNGRNALNWEDRFRHDIWYVDHCSFGLDLKIIGLTVLKLIQREGISEPGQATVRNFTGNGESRG